MMNETPHRIFYSSFLLDIRRLFAIIEKNQYIAVFLYAWSLSEFSFLHRVHGVARFLSGGVSGNSFPA